MKWGVDRDCRAWEPDLSAYLDGELDAARSCAVMRHLDDCGECQQKLNEFRHLGHVLRALPVPAPPPTLALRLRVAASRAGRPNQSLALARMRVADMLRTLTVPVAVGMCAALLAFAAFYGNLGAVIALANSQPDVPLAMASPPQLMQTEALGSLDAATLVEAHVDAHGRVYGYRLISGPQDGVSIARLNNLLLFSVFQPATTAMGVPTAGSVLVSFGTVHVRG